MLETLQSLCGKELLKEFSFLSNEVRIPLHKLLKGARVLRLEAASLLDHIIERVKEFMIDLVCFAGKVKLMTVLTVQSIRH